MNLFERQIRDLAIITSNAKEFQTITLQASTGEVIEVVGLHSKHHTGFNIDGERISTKTASVSISEEKLLGYPVRNSKGEVSMKNHLVTVKDSTNIDKRYKVSEFYPDERLGFITLILTDFE